jgi:hypothetical protein
MPRLWEHHDSGLWIIELPADRKPPGNCSGGGHSILPGTRYLMLQERAGVSLLPRPVNLRFCGKGEVVSYLRLMGENTGKKVYHEAANWFAANLPDNPELL